MSGRRLVYLAAAEGVWAASCLLLTRAGNGLGAAAALWAVGAALMAAVSILQAPGARGAARPTSVSLMDPVTGLGNRRAFDAMVTPLMDEAERLSEKALLIVINIDNYEQLGAAGKDVGDRAAVLVADALRDSLRGSDLVARYNEDEFICFLPKASNLFAAVIEERIHDNVAAGNRRFPGTGELRVSIGVAQLDPVAPVAPGTLVKEGYEDLFARLRAAGSDPSH